MSRIPSFEQEGFINPGVGSPTYPPMRGAPIKLPKSSAKPTGFEAPPVSSTSMPGQNAQQPQQPPAGAPTWSQTGQSLNEMYQRAKPLPGQMPPPGPQTDYIKAYEQLDKARQAVAVDPRFSPEQRQQAFERIASRADELDQGYLSGQELMQSPIGYDTPPAEEFGIMQQGFEVVGGGQVRNPVTGDIMPSIKSATGEIIPAPQTQPEIDALPDGAKYINPETGDVEVVGGGKGAGKTSRSSRAAATQAVDQLDMTPDDVAAAFEKWNTKQDPMSTAEEMAVVDKIISALPDEQENAVRAQIEANPEQAISLLSEYAPNIDIASELESARITAFANQEKARKGRVGKVARAMGIEMPEQEKAPVVNPDRYLVETGNQGTTRIRRRGNRQFSIPAIRGADGEIRPAPNAVRELADLDVDSEFVNIRPTEGGKQVRVLPFSAKTVNLENFALDDQQRAILATESGAIRPRTMQEWNRFEDELRKFEVTNEAWDPESLTPAQEQLQTLVNNFYRELSPKGRAAMTMYVAHSLGHEVSPERDFTSTGWVKKQIPVSQPQQTAESPSMMPSQRLSYLRDNNIPAVIAAADAGSEESYQGNLKNIFQTLNENADYYIAQQGVASDPRARRRLILEEIDQLAKTVRPGSFEDPSNYDRFVKDLYSYVGATPDWRSGKPATTAPTTAAPAAKPTEPAAKPMYNEYGLLESDMSQLRSLRDQVSREAGPTDAQIAEANRMEAAKKEEAARKSAAYKAEQAAATAEFERQNLPISSKRQEEIAAYNKQKAIEERAKLESAQKDVPRQMAVTERRRVAESIQNDIGKPIGQMSAEELRAFIAKRESDLKKFDRNRMPKAQAKAFMSNMQKQILVAKQLAERKGR